MRKEMGIKRRDEELEDMLKRLDTGNIEQSILNQLQRADKPIVQPIGKSLPQIIKGPVDAIAHAVTDENNDKKK
jgi:hypothetical protein